MSRWALAFMLIWCVPVGAQPIGLLFALDSDRTAFLKACSSVEPRTSPKGVSIVSAEFESKPVYVSTFERGNAESCLAASTLITTYGCRTICSLGPAAGINKKLKINSWYPVQMAANFSQGSISGGALKCKIRKRWPLTAFATQGTAELSNLCVGSSDLFVASTEFAHYLHAEQKIDLVDMMSSGIQYACEAFGVRHFSWRVVSDRADDTSPIDFAHFAQEYRGTGGHVAANALRMLPADPTSPNSYPAIRDLLSKPIPGRGIGR